MYKTSGKVGGKRPIVFVIIVEIELLFCNMGHSPTH